MKRFPDLKGLNGPCIPIFKTHSQHEQYSFALGQEMLHLTLCYIVLKYMRGGREDKNLAAPQFAAPPRSAMHFHVRLEVKGQVKISV